jgi:CHAT domain-containing protein/Tfp pilus assembly protein PilF
MINVRNALFSLAVLVSILLGLNGIVVAREHADALETPAYGILVERVESKSEAEQAGFQPGDILLSCTTGEGVNFPVQSPFGFYEIEILLNAWGGVTLQGTRGAETKVWTLKSSPVGLQIRPVLTGNIFILYDKARSLAEDGKAMEAAALWKSLAVEQAEFSSSPWLSSWLLFHAAELLARSHQWGEADRLYQEAVHYAQGAEPSVSSFILQTWAGTYQTRGDFDGAEKYYKQSLNKIHNKGDETLLAAKSLTSLSIIARNRGDLVKAESYAKLSLSIRGKLAPGSLWMANGLQSVGIIRWMVGDYSDAEDYYNRSREIYQKLAPDSVNLASNLNNLGILAWNRGDAVKAEEYYLDSLRIYRRLSPEDLDVAGIYLNLAAVVRRRGELESAEKYFVHALEIQEKIAPNSRDVAQSLNGLAILATSRRDLVNAEKYCRRALEILERTSPNSADAAMSFSNLADVLRVSGDLVKAEEYYLMALQIQQRISTSNYDYGNTLNNLGSLAYERNNLTQAAEHYQQALAVFQKLAPGSMEYAESLSGLAFVSQRQGQLDAAAQYFEKALAVLENHAAHLGGSKEAQTGLRAQHSDYYLKYIDLLMDQNRPELAFEVLERWHARSLLELLTEAQVDIEKGADPALLQQERLVKERLTAKTNQQIQAINGKDNNKERIAAINKEIEELLAQFHQIEGHLRATSARYAALFHPERLNVREVQQQLLDKDTLLIEYALGDEQSYVWIVDESSLETHQLPKRAIIEGAARRFYNSLTVRSHLHKIETGIQRHTRLQYAGLERERAAVALSKMVVRPIARRLKNKRLLIVADGALQYIPFAALPEPDIKERGMASQPLIVRHEIVNLPSASVLSVLRQHSATRKVPPHLVAILADPVFSETDSRVIGKREAQKTAQALPPGPIAQATQFWTRSINDVGLLGFGRLPFSRQEAKAIMSLAPSGEGMEALDFRASRSTAVSKALAQYKIIHFATHGLLNSKHPELSGVVLSLVDQEGRPQNGFLGLQEVYNLNLPAELVVLSACETGLGKEIRGEGLVGLTRGFMYAGASRVAASLWSIDDAATAELMTRFYKAMLRDGLSPPAALRRSQLQMRQQERFADPYYWASFIIQGEWKGAFPVVRHGLLVGERHR